MKFFMLKYSNLFPRGAKASALTFMIIQTAIQNNLKLYHYLNFVFSKI